MRSRFSFLISIFHGKASNRFLILSKLSNVRGKDDDRSYKKKKKKIENLTLNMFTVII